MIDLRKKLKDGDQQPLSIKIFTKGGIIFFGIILLVVILFLCEDMLNKNNRNNYLTLSDLNLQSESELI